MKHPVLSCLLVVVAASMLGCTAQPKARKPRHELEFGPIDPAARRAAGLDVDSLFEAMDYAAPNERRLASGAPGPDYWQQQVDYDIDCRIDTENDSVHGTEHVTYHNNSPHRLSYIWIQLQQNLFNPKSIGARSHTPGQILHGELTFEGGDQIGWIRSNGQDLEYHIYDTVARIELPAPIEPGAVFNFDVDWSFKIPPYYRRMGVERVEDGKVFELAQWFPSVCVYDDVHGWNTLPYLGAGEFYNNYGSYNVNITVPATYLVSATGMLQNESDVLPQTLRDRLATAMSSDEPVWIVGADEVGTPGTRPRTDGEMAWRFHADMVRTFAFAASDAFQWDACRATVKDKSGAQRSVRVQSFYPKEAKAWSADDEDGGSTRSVKHSIEFYSGFVYPYAYPVMSNINGPEDGMEYPMIVFCGARKHSRGMNGVTDHEVGHSWFPMMVNTDERRHVWMDEGFNTFINVYSRADFYHKPINVDQHRQQTIALAKADNRQPIVLAPDNMWHSWLGMLGYRKTGMGLVLLREQILGPDRFDTAFHEYVDRWVFKSPRPDDFFRSMEDSAGMDLGWFWKGWFLGTGGVDFAVTEAGTASNGENGFATFCNLGGVVLPLPYRVTYADGTTEDCRLPVQAWAQSDVWKAVIDAKGRAISKIQIDPDGLIPDSNARNNVWER
ncbi:MAG: M1 family metallopeptidase [Phycisphaeraceae bacterium]|nr:MAG: M1 family metallopeptidase [Phycisphaeraceae bacterium]